jgi:hypothetical protein
MVEKDEGHQFEGWCEKWRSSLLGRIKKERNIVCTVKMRKAKRLVTACVGRKDKGRTELTGRRGTRCKQLPDDLKEREDTGNLIRKHCMALCGELALEDAMGLS